MSVCCARTPSSVEPEKVFTYFSLLPSKVRCRIWKLACIITRNIGIMADATPTRDMETELGDIETQSKFVFGYRAMCPPPALLHCNAESRKEGLRHYALDFGVSFTNEGHNFPTTPKIYINWSIDRLCLFDDFCNFLRPPIRHDFSKRIWDNDLQLLAINNHEFGVPILECHGLYSYKIRELILFNFDIDAYLDGSHPPGPRTLTFREPPGNDQTLLEQQHAVEILEYMMGAEEKQAIEDEAVSDVNDEASSGSSAIDEDATWAIPEVKIMDLWVDDCDTAWEQAVGSVIQGLDFDGESVFLIQRI